MSNPRVTDERLRSWLDGDQLARERLCLAVMSLDRRFANVKPRSPRGGPDGGRDIEAVFQDGRDAWGAVGFQNSVSDSATERRKAISKFHTDLQRAKKEMPDLQVFVFLTNVALKTSERAKLAAYGRNLGLDVTEVFDRERLRIVLDSPDGLAARYQYLAIPLSDAEQAAFFSKWGSGIEGLLTRSITTVERRLARLEFNMERSLPLTSLWCHVRLKTPISRAELGPFRFEWYLNVLPPKPGLMAAHFGVCSGHRAFGRNKHEPERTDCQSGISWIERHRAAPRVLARSWAVLPDPVCSLAASVGDSYLNTPALDISLGQLDRAFVAFFMNSRLAPLIGQIALYANEYLLTTLTHDEFDITQHDGIVQWPFQFETDELSERWVRVMSKRG